MRCLMNEKPTKQKPSWVTIAHSAEEDCVRVSEPFDNASQFPWFSLTFHELHPTSFHHGRQKSAQGNTKSWATFGNENKFIEVPCPAFRPCSDTSQCLKRRKFVSLLSLSLFYIRHIVYTCVRVCRLCVCVCVHMLET